MKIIIQCAGKKRSNAGHFNEQIGKPVLFVAQPSHMNLAESVNLNCRPDQWPHNESSTWREKLAYYNVKFAQDGSNPDKLLPAGKLYAPAVYENLVQCFGAEKVFILSAGWGLVRADYLLPAYNITFSKKPGIPKECLRNVHDSNWLDFNQLEDRVEDGEEVHFFGGQDYLDLFYSLTASETHRGKFVVHHKAAIKPRNGYSYTAYLSHTKTNWHYPAAKEFMLALRQEKV